MKEQLFKSVFDSASGVADPIQLALSLVVSLALGVLLALVYKHKTLYSKEFVITLTMLPMLMAMIIFMVNGNLGTSVAIAGTFGMIRFRSAAGGAKELLSVFIATGIGLACGMGFLVLAAIFTVFVCIVLLLLENTSFATVSQTRRQITIRVPRDLNYELLFEATFVNACKYVELVSIKNVKKSNTLELSYNVDLDASLTDKQVIDRLLAINEDIEINISKLAQKKKTL
ncbi:TPA: DUF4956 domain-containing protein [Streptococcus suis]|nr:DUF4956 domain-containing protein [Streptococcus suis]